MKKMFKFKICLENADEESSEIALALSKTVLGLEQLNNKYAGKVSFVPTQINLSEEKVDGKNIGELIFQVNLQNESLKEKVATEINSLLDSVSSGYKIEEITIGE